MTLRTLALTATLLALSPMLIWLGTNYMAGSVIADLFLTIQLGLYAVGAGFYLLICALTIISHDDRVRRFFDAL